MEDRTKNWKDKLHDVIYGTETPAGKLFDIVLLFAILVSILLVMLESVESFDNKYHDLLDTAEWIITFLFTLEYFARIISIKKPTKYIFSFYGIVDFLSTIPKYLSLFLIGSHSLVALRAFRLLRVFRVLKVSRYIGESNQLIKSLNASKAKISVFLYFVLIICIILGSVMYFIEGAENGFTSIPRSIYWSIVTLTTVGYGDIAPQTALGQLIASVTVIIGYAIIAIPTGIVSSEMARKQALSDSKKCDGCSTTGHKDDADFCYNCGTKLN